MQDASTGVRAQRDGGVLRLTLDRPDVHNALDHAMVSDLTRWFLRAADDTAIRVVVLASTGPNFSAGVDLAKLRHLRDAGQAESTEDARAIADMLAALFDLPQPTVAAVQGPVFGGALALVAACDLTVATQAAVFAAGEARLGLTPVLLTPYLAAAIGLRAARRMLLTCERIDAAQAQAFGLVHRVVAAEGLDQAVAALIGRLLRCGPGALAATKRILAAGAPVPLAEADRARAAATIATARATAEAREGVGAFLEKRPPAWAAPQ